MQNFSNVENLQNATVYGTDGDKIGSVGQVYLDDQTNQPTFVTVHTGLFGMKETFIPVSQATSTDDGLQIPFDKAFVKDAPNIDADGSLTPEDEQRIYDYYSMDYQDTGRGDAGVGGTERDAEATGRDVTGTERDADMDAGLAASSGTAASGISGLGAQRGGRNDVAADLDSDTAGRDVDTTSRDAGTDQDTESVAARNEQRDVGTEAHGTSRVRLRKHTYVDIETVEG